MNDHVDIAIIGAGFAGIGAAVRLAQAGFEEGKQRVAIVMPGLE